MTLKSRKVTIEEFIAFKKYVRKLLDLLNLKDYSVAILMKELEGNYAQINTDVENRVVNIYFNTKYKDCPENDAGFDIKKIAAHEVTHLLVAKLVWLAESRFLNPNELHDEDEHIARALEGVLCKIL